MDCLFCKIIKNELPSYVLSETDETLSILDIFPNSDGHILVIAKNHCRDFHLLSDNQATALFREAKALIGALKQAGFSPDYNLLINNGSLAGQAIPHVHLHIIPRYEGDHLLPIKTGGKRDESYYLNIQTKLRIALFGAE